MAVLLHNLPIYQVHVNAIAPSIVVTELTKSMLDDPARAKALTSRVPLGRLAEVEHIIGSAIFLASRASDYITGQVIHVDGVMSAGILYCQRFQHPIS